MENRFNLKTKHLILIGIATAIFMSFMAKKLADMRRAKLARQAYGDENISAAQRLFNALYPEGRINSKFSILSPFKSAVDSVKGALKSGADVSKVLSVGRDYVNSDNFKKISKAYKGLYGTDLLLDLQERLDEDFAKFDDIIQNKQTVIDKPEIYNRKLDNLAYSIFKDVHAFGSADDDLYDQLYALSDADFEYVYHKFSDYQHADGNEDTLAQEIADDSWSIDLDQELKARFLKLGLR